jgi:outer membrane protein, heavy metal efflux system
MINLNFVKNLALAFCALLAMESLSAQTQAPATTPAAAVTFEQNLSLPELISRVLVANSDLKIAKESIAASRADLVTAKSYVNPKFEWMAGQYQAKVPGAASGSGLSVGLSQLIENPLLRQSRINAGEAAQNESGLQLQRLHLQIVAQVELLAYEYFFRREMASVFKNDVELLTLVRERIQVRVQSGESPKYDLIKADTELINAQQKFDSMKLQALQSLTAIDKLAAGQLPKSWQLMGLLIRQVDVRSLELELAQIDSKNLELAALRERVQKMQHQLQVAKSSRWPGVELRVNQNLDPQNRITTVGFQVPLPLWSQQQGPIAKAQSELNQSKLALEGRTSELMQEVTHAWRAQRIAQTRIEALAQGAVVEAENALKVVQAAYRFGEKGLLEVLDAQRVLQSVRTSLLDARYQLQVARIELELLSGANHARITQYLDTPTEKENK